MNRLIFILIMLLFLLPSITFAEALGLSLDQVRLADLARVVYGEVLRKPFVLDDELLRSQDSLTITWNNAKPSQLDSMMQDLLRQRGFEIEEIRGVMFVRKRNDDDQDLMVYLPRNRSAKYLADILHKVAGVQQLGSRGMTASPEFQQAAQKTQDQGTALGQFDRSAPDQLAYACRPAKCDRLRKLLTDLDTPEPQVVVRAVLYEVGTTKNEGSAVQIAATLLNGKAAIHAGALLSGANTFTVGTNLDSVISILDQDARFKVVSRPSLRVKTGAQARFSVGQQVPVLGAIAQDKNGNPQQSVEYRQSGTIFTVQPDVRQDVVDLNVTQELSSFVATSTGVNNSPTLLQRTATSQLTVKPGELAIFAGLEESREDEARSSLFGFSTGKKSGNTSSEVLLFIEAQRI